jgi:hypothetical protein
MRLLVLASMTAIGGMLPDTKMIGVKPDDTPEGTDIIVPVLQVNIAIKMPRGTITPAYAKLLGRCTGTVNENTWLTFEGGEALYMGADFSYGDDQPVEVIHHIGFSENLVDVDFAGQTITKDGWDIAWPKYRRSIEVDTYNLESVGVYVQRTLRRTDFASFLGFS